MSNWGIPDWRDSSAYGDTKRWSESRWRWEFTRRRPDCRADFLQYAEETLRLMEKLQEERAKRAPGRKLNRLLQLHEPGFCAVNVPDAQKKYRLVNVPNPAIGNQPWTVLHFLPFSDGSVFSLDKCGLAKGAHVNIKADNGVIEASIDESLVSVALSIDIMNKIEPVDALIAINLSSSISKQLERARGALERMQEKQIGRVLRRRLHPKKWLTYLRVLDAREDNTTLSGIALSGILGNLIRSNSKPEDSSQAARQVWKAARELMFNWPN